MLQQDEQISHEDSEFAHWAHYESESPVLNLNQRLSFYSPQNQPSNPSYHHHEDHLRHDTLPLLSGGLRSNPEVISPIVVSDKDAFAARGLLALISSEDVTPTLDARPRIGFHGRTTSDSTPLTRIDENSYTDVTTTRSAASKRTTALLRHYRYEVAPWVHSFIPTFPYLVLMFLLTLYKQLDLCDMYQSFGIVAFQYAIDSEQIFRALILLSEASLCNRNLDGRSSSEQYRSPSSLDISNLDFAHDDSGDGDHSLLTIALTTIFRRVHVFVSNLSRAWFNNGIPVDRDIVSSLIMDIATSKPTAAIYWLFLRLGMSLLNQISSK